MISDKRPCGCHISHIGHQPEQIVYCPLHAAAEKIVRILTATDAIDYAELVEKYRQEHGKYCPAAGLRAYATVVSKATGKESL